MAHTRAAASGRRYIDGSAQGDAAKLEEAFHERAQMYGAVGADRYDEPTGEYTKLMAESPGGDTLRARIASITQAGDAATATAIETASGGRCRSSRSSRSPASDGRWRVVNKTFAHTGGEMPAEA